MNIMMWTEIAHTLLQPYLVVSNWHILFCNPYFNLKSLHFKCKKRLNLKFLQSLTLRLDGLSLLLSVSLSVPAMGERVMLCSHMAVLSANVIGQIKHTHKHTHSMASGVVYYFQIKFSKQMHFTFVQKAGGKQNFIKTFKSFLSIFYWSQSIFWIKW